MKNAKLWKPTFVLIAKIGFACYLLLLIYFVLFSERYGRTEPYIMRQYNLIPFREIHRYLFYTYAVSVEAFVTNLIGNIFAFSPFGFFLPLIFAKKKRGLIFVTVATALLSFFIESMQFLMRVGVFDVDDLILNTVGGMLGFFLYLFVRLIYHKCITKGKKGERNV